MSASSVRFVVGNTYQKLPLSESRLDRSGNFRKIHDWILFLDVLEGSDPDLIERVSFDLGPSFQPQVFICATPVPVQRPDGSKAWRFSTRQQTYGSINAIIKIRGAGGTVQQTTHFILLDDKSYEKKSLVQTFQEARAVKPLRMLKLADTVCFGIELELTSAVHVQLEQVADSLQRAGNVGTFDVIRNYSAGRVTSNAWKLVPDSSIVCSVSLPDCNKFELVSPVLKGGDGLQQVASICKALANIEPKPKVNKSMGFHVHVDVSGLQHAQLVKVCQNFIKYEDVMDTFMPPSRRDGSSESEKYFQSNRECVEGSTNKQRYVALATCKDTASLVQMMNRDGRYYKLNLQNLVTGRQPTIEFRQHSATMNYEKISAWIRFCVAFVTNSAKFVSPSPLAKNRSLEYQFHALFQYVIKDRALRNYYLQRRERLSAGDDDEGAGACCSECANGGMCMAKRQRT